MTKQIIAGALSVAIGVSSFALLVVPTFAATTSWHQVTVTPGQELILGGNTSSNTTLSPTITTPASDAAGAMSVQSTVAWKIQWQAVQGPYTPTPGTTAAIGTNLGTAGFTDTGGYAYAGSQTAATTGNTWGVVLAVANGASLAATPTLDFAALSDAATGSSTVSATLTPTYSASTTGSLGNTSYYGTIYYVLSAQ